MRQLRSADPTRRAEDLRRGVVVLPPPKQPKQPSVVVLVEEDRTNSSKDDDDDDDDSEYDFEEAELMEELLAARMRQAARVVLVSDVVDLPQAPIVVMHSYDPDSRDGGMDEALEVLAAEYPKVRFCRSLSGEAVRDLVFESDRIAPEKLRGSVCVFRESKLVALSATSTFSEQGDQVVAIDALSQWLDRAGAFDDISPLRGTSQLVPEEQEDNVEEEKYFQCGRPGCNKVFEHHHIGSTIPVDWDVHRRNDLPSF